MKKRRTDTWRPADSQETFRAHKRPHRDVGNTGDARDQYRPEYTTNQDKGTRRPRRADMSPEREKPLSRRRPHASADSRANHQSTRTPAHSQRFQPKNHSTKSRKTNPSTRIRSLRKQLEHSTAATMPANILADKQRELKFLLDSRKDALQTNGTDHAPKRDRKGKKMLRQYHMVRFFERKKAERNLKRARKPVDTEEQDGDEAKQHQAESAPRASQDEIRRYESDLLYCLYAPLGEKYIALYAGDGHSQKTKSKSEEGAGLPIENPHLIRISVQGQDETFRPPYWYTIQSILQNQNAADTEGITDLASVPEDNDARSSVAVTRAQLAQLEALRDSKDISDTSKVKQPATSGAGLAVRSREPIAGQKRKVPSWQEETDAPIDPMDADSDDLEDGGMVLDAKDGDGSESDGDGGFFER